MHKRITFMLMYEYVSKYKDQNEIPMNSSKHILREYIITIKLNTKRKTTFGEVKIK